MVSLLGQGRKTVGPRLTAFAHIKLYGTINTMFVKSRGCSPRFGGVSQIYIHIGGLS